MKEFSCNFSIGVMMAAENDLLYGFLHTLKLFFMRLGRHKRVPFAIQQQNFFFAQLLLLCNQSVDHNFSLAI
jgi:hypothetical protein